MPRPDRVLVEGGVYHVYNRLGRGERVFEREEVALGFERLLREVVERDELTVFAWCLMPNHYHLAVRTGVVPLDRPMRSLQQRVARRVNLSDRVHGPLWQGRYRSKLVDEGRYLDRLLVYIHLNPVTAGLVDDPGVYRWSGHRDVLGEVRKPIIDVDEVLRVFGTTRRAARSAYVRALKGAVGEEWIGETPGRVPWWRLGRPPRGEEEDPEETVRARREQEERGPEWRPTFGAGELIRRAAEALGVEVRDLRSRSRRADLVHARELLMVLAVERYSLKVRDVARELDKSADGMSQALARGVERRKRGGEFRAELDDLDRRVASPGAATSAIAAGSAQ